MTIIYSTPVLTDFPQRLYNLKKQLDFDVILYSSLFGFARVAFSVSLIFTFHDTLSECKRAPFVQSVDIMFECLTDLV